MNNAVFFCSISSASVQKKETLASRDIPPVSPRKKEPLFSAGASEEDVLLRCDLLPTLWTIRCRKLDLLSRKSRGKDSIYLLCLSACLSCLSSCLSFMLYACLTFLNVCRSVSHASPPCFLSCHSVLLANSFLSVFLLKILIFLSFCTSVLHLSIPALHFCTIFFLSCIFSCLLHACLPLSFLVCLPASFPACKVIKYLSAGLPASISASIKICHLLQVCRPA